MGHLLKGGGLGGGIGLLVGGLLYLALTSSYPNYPYQTDDFTQMFHGATGTAIILLALFLFFGDPKRSVEDIRALELLLGIISGIVLGIFSPLLFWGPISLLSTELVNAVADAISGFVAGAASAGFFVGMIVSRSRD